MNKMVAFCGIVCTECPAFVATQNDDDVGRKKVAEAWSKQFNMPMKPEDVNCDGCVSGSKRLVNYCHICEIRKCGQAKLVVNCAHCDDYACEKLTKFFATAPQTKATLEEIKKSL